MHFTKRNQSNQIRAITVIVCSAVHPSRIKTLSSWHLSGRYIHWLLISSDKNVCQSMMYVLFTLSHSSCAVGWLSCRNPTTCTTATASGRQDSSTNRQSALRPAPMIRVWSLSQRTKIVSLCYYDAHLKLVTDSACCRPNCLLGLKFVLRHYIVKH